MCRERTNIKKVKVLTSSGTSKTVPRAGQSDLMILPLLKNDHIKYLLFILHSLFVKYQSLANWTLTVQRTQWGRGGGVEEAREVWSFTVNGLPADNSQAIAPLRILGK